MPIARLRLDGRELADGSVRVKVPPRSCAPAVRCGPEFATPADPAAEMLVATALTGRATRFWKPDRQLQYARPEFAAELISGMAGHRLTVTAAVPLVDPALFPDRLDADAAVNDQLITLLPGESFTFVIETAGTITADELTRPPVLQCANRFGAGGTGGK